jgi:hypothetical protein
MAKGKLGYFAEQKCKDSHGDGTVYKERNVKLRVEFGGTVDQTQNKIQTLRKRACVNKSVHGNISCMAQMPRENT